MALHTEKRGWNGPETFNFGNRVRRNMGRYGELDYPRLAKTGFLLGLGLLLVGALGGAIAHAYFEPLPNWEGTLLFDVEVVGLLIGFFSPFVFGIFLPLTE